MKYLSADCILPVSGEACYHSVLAVADDGTIEGIYDKKELNVAVSEIKHYKGILCPGFINTHCHLELSWVKGLIPESGGLDKFILQLDALRRSVSEPAILKSIEEEAIKMEQSGIVATADIVNRHHTLAYKSKSRHYFHTFVEVFGSAPAHAKSFFENAIKLKSDFDAQLPPASVSLAPHATYSLSEELFRLIAAFAHGELISIHHQENEDENFFFKDGSGRIGARRKLFNPDIEPFAGTGKRPMQSIAGYFSPDQKILLVHNTVSQQQDIDFVEEYFRNAYWCFCPNANLFIENRLPDINLFRSSNCRITLGTDSLASNRQLSIFEEIKTIQLHFPEIPLTELIKWGTLNGAGFLGLDQKLGSFEKGKKPGVVLIENIDLLNLQLTTESTSRLIIPAHL